MSKPLTAVKSRVAPPRVTVRTSAAVPLFGGLCSNSVFVTSSRWYRLVNPGGASGWPKLLVYAAAVADVGPPTPVLLIEPSGLSPMTLIAAPPLFPSTAAPVFGLARALNPPPAVMRIRSTVGLKSNP